MSLVDTTTAFLVDIADHEEATRIAADTTAVVAHFNVWSGKMIDQIVLETFISCGILSFQNFNPQNSRPFNGSRIT